MKEINDAQSHWENVFQNKDTSKVSWFQNRPQRSLDLIKKYCLDKSKAIIEVGGGDSRLPDCLIEKDYRNITVLDISSVAVELSKERLRDDASKISWIVGNVLNFESDTEFDVWHDRAVFHFLMEEQDQQEYKKQLLSKLSGSAILIIGAFSKNSGVERCSGLMVNKQSRESILNLFEPEFALVDDFEEVHVTPSGSSQNFYWSILQKQ